MVPDNRTSRAFRAQKGLSKRRIEPGCPGGAADQYSKCYKETPRSRRKTPPHS